MPDTTARAQIIAALLAAGVPHGTSPDGAMLFAWPAALAPLALPRRADGEPWDSVAARMVVAGRLPLVHDALLANGGRYTTVHVDDLIRVFGGLSTLPAKPRQPEQS